MVTNKYVEYNMINNIPILYPTDLDTSLNYNIFYAPRYTIADADRLLHCFDKDKSTIYIQNTVFRYIRVPLNKSFTTLDGVRALYYYVMVDNTIDLDGFDFKNTSTVLKWLRGRSNNHYVLVTTPVLQYKHMYYNVSNDNNFNIIQHTANDLMDDRRVLTKLIKDNCYTICDNYNIVISLYQKMIIDQTVFISMIKFLNQLKNFYYTSSVWMYLINNHRILSACDFPILHMSLTPHLLTDDTDSSTIINVIEPKLYYFRCHNAYMQTSHKNNILFTTFISASYPNTDLNFLKSILGDNLADMLWFSYTNIPKQYWIFSKESIFVNDLYGLFAAFVHKNDMWQYWCKNKTLLLTKLENNHSNTKCVLFDVLCPLFRLYNVGYEGITIKRKRVRRIWNDVLIQNVYDTRSESKTIIRDILQCFAVLNKNVCVPYSFLLDIYQKFNINFGEQILIKNMYFNRFIYKQSTMYTMLNCRTVKDSFYYFHRNVLKKRSIYILMCIYKRFGLSVTSGPNSLLQTGHILIDYLRDNVKYLC
jgi:hypothetical protein